MPDSIVLTATVVAPCLGIIRLSEENDWGLKLVGSDVIICGMNGEIISHLFGITCGKLIKYAHVSRDYITTSYNGYVADRTWTTAMAVRRRATTMLNPSVLRLCRRTRQGFRSNDVFLTYGEHELVSITAYGITRMPVPNCSEFMRDRNGRVVPVDQEVSRAPSF